MEQDALEELMDAEADLDLPALHLDHVWWPRWSTNPENTGASRTAA
ncbi:hypothetical protein VR010_04555 [Actinomycetaceae bacterium L2_0104]